MRLIWCTPASAFGNRCRQILPSPVTATRIIWLRTLQLSILLAFCIQLLLQAIDVLHQIGMCTLDPASVCAVAI